MAVREHPSVIALRKVSPIINAIIDGDHDDLLGDLDRAIKFRKKQMFRPRSRGRDGTKVKLVNTRNPEIEGQVGEVLKVNPKRITVGLGELDEFGEYPIHQTLLVPVNMLEILS